MEKKIYRQIIGVLIMFLLSLVPAIVSVLIKNDAFYKVFFILCFIGLLCATFIVYRGYLIIEGDDIEIYLTLFNGDGSFQSNWYKKLELKRTDIKKVYYSETTSVGLKVKKLNFLLNNESFFSIQLNGFRRRHQDAILNDFGIID